MNLDGFSPEGTPDNRLSPRERYRRDPAFRTLVDIIRAMIDRAEYTPTEIREASMLAAVMQAELTIRDRIFV